MNKSKSIKIQILRGLAIIAVVFIHNTPNGLDQVYVRPLLNFSVGMFLFLSGMLSSSERWNPKKRIIKVLIPYILWTLIYSILYNMQSPSMIFKIYLKNLLFGSASAIMYYVFIYCQLTILIPIVDRLARSKYKYLGFLVSPLEIIIMRLIPMTFGYSVHPTVSTIIGLSCVGWFIYFYLGYLIGNNIIEIHFKIHILFSAWIGSIVLQIVEGYWYYSNGIINCGTQLKLSSILSGCIFMIIAYKFINSKLGTNWKILPLIGDKSFGIYFSHLAIMNLLNRIPFYANNNQFPWNALFIVFISFLFVLSSSKILGKYGKMLAI